MSAKIEKFIIATKGFNDVIDITSKVQDVIFNSGIISGIMNVSVLGGGASVLILENEPFLAQDLTKLFDSIVPVNKVYQHDNIWHEGNAFSHLKGAILGNNVNFSIVDSKISINSNQQVLLIDFDNKPNNREIIVSVVF